MPYVLSFIRRVEIVDAQQYINDCCVGGDIVLSQLLPVLRERYVGFMSEQEDWGWFAWFESVGVKLAVEVHTDDVEAGEFQIHLTSRKPRFLFGTKVLDTTELEELREMVEKQLQSWGVERLVTERVNEEYMPE